MDSLINDEGSLVFDPKRLYNALLQAPAAVAVSRWYRDRLVFEFSNEMYNELVGRKNLVGKSLDEAFPELETENPGMLKIIHDVSKKGERFEATEMPITLDWNREGKLSERFINFSYLPVFDDVGQPDGLMAFAYDVTEQVTNRKIVEKAKILGDIERENLRSLFDQTPEFFCIIAGRELRFEYVNSSHKAIFGGEDLTGRTVREAQPELAESGFIDLLEGVIDTGVAAVVRESPAMIRDEMRYFDLIYAPRRNSKGEVDGILALGTDITEKINARKKIEENETRFRLMAEAMPQFVWTARPDGVLDYTNQSWFEYSGSKDPEIWHTFVHPEDLERVFPIWMDSVAHGKNYATEFRLLRKIDQKYRWHLVRANPLFGSDNKVQKWIGTCTDIEDQKQAEATLRDSQKALEKEVSKRTQELETERAFLKGLLENLDAGVISCNSNFELTLSNKAMRDLMGLPDDSLPPEQWSNHFDSFYADGVTPIPQGSGPLAEALKGKVIRDNEVVIRWKNGERKSARVSATPLLQKEKVIGAVGVVHDITDIKNAENLLKDTNSALEATNKELEAFSYSVSHDLRTPLRGIDGFAKALSDDFESVLDSTGKKYLSFIRDGVQRMGVLIDDLLDLSRLSRVELTKTSVNLTDLSHEVIKALRDRDPKRKVEIVVQEGLNTTGDKGLLFIALENLIANAWKFTANTENAKITVGQKIVDGQTAFFVQDNGAGFEMQFKDKLFGAFQRLHSNREFEGTGIGLATVRRILNRHGGNVWAEGKVNEGATFYFVI